MRKLLLAGVLVAMAGAVLVAVPAFAQFPRCLTEDGYTYCTYRVTDGVTTAADGTAVYLGPYESMVVIPQSGVDASNTYDVNCGFSASKDTEPTTWDEVLDTTSDTDVYAMPAAHPCEWVRVDKVADDGTATTIDVQIVRPR